MSPLFSSLYDVVCKRMGLNERDLTAVHDFVESLERDEEVLASEREEM